MPTSAGNTVTSGVEIDAGAGETEWKVRRREREGEAGTSKRRDRAIWRTNHLIQKGVRTFLFVSSRHATYFPLSTRRCWHLSQKQKKVHCCWIC